jgi:hypothetical protein
VTERIEARAFRGTRKASVYRGHVLDADNLDRIAEAGRRAGFDLVASLAAVPSEVGKEDARALAVELSELRVGAELLDLDDDLAALAELARFCARTRGGAWLTLVAAS